MKHFAIVDIETTGGNPLQGGITEIAVIVHDGSRVVDQFHTLLNPERFIPGFITGLTGINQEMVEHAPTFAEKAGELYEFLKDHVFVAHNVSFDYGFIKEAFRKEGLTYQAPKLCTVRLSRKAFPGFKSYSLGRICEQMDILITNRHRAFGDAEATAILFGKIHEQNPELIYQSLKKNNGEAFLPPHISKEKFLQIPEDTGIYYFHDARGQVIYVGKALNIRSRFKGHFSGTSKEKSKMALRTEIHDVSWEVTGSEFLAYLLELLEIKRLWPKYNRAQKFKLTRWGLITYQDGQGFIRFQVAKVSPAIHPVHHFDSHSEAWKFLMDNVEKYTLCPKLSGIQKRHEACYDFLIQKCHGACCGKEEVDTYNARAEAFLAELKAHSGNILIRDKGRTVAEQSAIFFENGFFSGYGFIENSTSINHPEDMMHYIQKVKLHPESKYILRGFLSKIPLDNIQVMGE